MLNKTYNFVASVLTSTMVPEIMLPTLAVDTGVLPFELEEAGSNSLVILHMSASRCINSLW